MSTEAMHLSPAEIAEASGATRRAKQMGWFLALGIPAVLGADGKVKVLRAAYNAKMMPGGSVPPRARVKTAPRLDLIKKAG